MGRASSYSGDHAEERRSSDGAGLHQQTEALLHAIPGFVYLWDRERARVVRSNGRMAEYLGFSREQVAHLTEGEFAASVAFPGEAAEHLQAIQDQKNLRRGDVFERQLRLRTGNGEYRWFNHAVKGLSFSADGTVVQWIGTLADVHDLVVATERAQELERRFRELFDRSPAGTALINDDGLLMEANSALCRFLGRERSELIGSAYDAFLIPEERGEARDRRVLLGAGVDLPPVERRFLDPEGNVLWASVAHTRIVDDGRWVSLVTFEDVTLQKQATARLEHAATHDSLTGLPNRRLLSDRLERALAKARRDPNTVTVLFLDLDLVKAVNDTYGHEAGDELLIAVARRLLGTVREGDTVARLGGDEFVVVCDDIASSTQIVDLADRILAVVSEPVEVLGHRVSVTASLGIATSRNGQATGDELVRAADMAMYEAKSTGRARYVLSATPAE